MLKAELFLHAQAKLAEGPIYDGEASLLRWVDINGRKLHATSPDGRRDTVIDTPQSITAVALCESGGLLVALADGIYKMEEDGVFTSLARHGEPADSRCNDGKADPRGRYFIGTLANSFRKNAASLYLYEGNGALTKKLDGVTISNGIAFSPDERYMYYNDTPYGFMRRFDYDADTAEMTNETKFIDYRDDPGSFDGMTMDEHGNLWVACWGGFCVRVYDGATGAALDEIALPVPNVSSCAFMGRSLVITTAESEHTGAGDLYIVEDTGVCGRQEYKVKA